MFKKILPLLILSLLLTPSIMLNAQGIQIPDNTGLPSGTIEAVLDNVLNWLLKIFIVLATISFVITGLQFIFSFGGASGTEAQAKKNFTYTIIAIFIVGGSLIILNAILGFLGPANSSGGGNASPDFYGTDTYDLDYGQNVYGGNLDASGNPIDNSSDGFTTDGTSYAPDYNNNSQGGMTADDLGGRTADSNDEMYEPF